MKENDKLLYKTLKTLLNEKLSETEVNALKEEKEEVKEIIKEKMENAVELRVPLVAEVKEGRSWYETK